MGDVSKHFNRSEFACKCGCGFKAVDQDLLNVLENVRIRFDAPVIIDCACRCPEHNAAVGGVSDSQHVFGMAADIKVSGIKPSDVATYLEKDFPDCGIGRYSSFTHVDVRGSAARWTG